MPKRTGFTKTKISENALRKVAPPSSFSILFIFESFLFRHYTALLIFLIFVFVVKKDQPVLGQFLEIVFVTEINVFLKSSFTVEPRYI